jgi:hypothetical protein
MTGGPLVVNIGASAVAATDGGPPVALVETDHDVCPLLWKSVAYRWPTSGPPKHD